jgi:hypothetical protein
MSDDIDLTPDAVERLAKRVSPILEETRTVTLFASTAGEVAGTLRALSARLAEVEADKNAMSNKFSISDLHKDADGAISEPHLVQVLYKRGVPIAIDLPSFATEAMKQMQDALIRAALEVAAVKMTERHEVYMTAKGRDPKYYVSDWSMTADYFRALAADPKALAAIKAKAGEPK